MGIRKADGCPGQAVGQDEGESGCIGDSSDAAAGVAAGATGADGVETESAESAPCGALKDVAEVPDCANGPLDAPPGGAVNAEATGGPAEDAITGADTADELDTPPAPTVVATGIGIGR